LRCIIIILFTVPCSVWWWLYRYASHNNVSINDGPHIRRWSQKII